MYVEKMMLKQKAHESTVLNIYIYIYRYIHMHLKSNTLGIKYT